jgi:hypothetical protein
LHATKADILKGGIVINTTAPLERGVDEILLKCRLAAEIDDSADTVTKLSRARKPRE